MGKGHRSPSQARSVKVKSGKERVGLQGTAKKESPPPRHLCMAESRCPAERRAHYQERNAKERHPFGRGDVELSFGAE